MADSDSDADSILHGFAISEDLVQSPEHKAAATNEVDFDGLLQDHPLKLYEDLAKGNGGQAWPAGRTLAKYLLRRKRDELKNCSMLGGRLLEAVCKAQAADQVSAVSSWVLVEDWLGNYTHEHWS
jgi:hypothetical protein